MLLSWKCFARVMSVCATRTQGTAEMAGGLTLEATGLRVSYGVHRTKQKQIPVALREETAILEAMDDEDEVLAVDGHDEYTLTCTCNVGFFPPGLPRNAVQFPTCSRPVPEHLLVINALILSLTTPANLWVFCTAQMCWCVRALVGEKELVVYEAWYVALGSLRNTHTNPIPTHS